MKKQKLVFLIDSLKIFNSVSHKKLKFSSEYLNTFQDKSVSLWNRNKLVKNKRSIIATATIVSIFLIPSLVISKSVRNENVALRNSQYILRGPRGDLIALCSLSSIAGTFSIAAITLGIKRAIIMKKSKQKKLICNF